MTRTLVHVLALLVVAGPLPLRAQDVSTEYRVKAAFLYNFVKFVEWPAGSDSGPLEICVAGQNPFGDVLSEIVRGETINGRPIRARVILEPAPSCHMVFVPRGANTSAYLRAARGTPTLTVGETPAFITQGGFVRFYIDSGNVRFEIAREAAERTGLRISSRLLQLAKIVPEAGATQ